MKKLNLKLLVASLAAVLGFASCNTESVNPNIPQIDIEGGRTVYAPAARSQVNVNVISNRDWTVTIPAQYEWLAVTPIKGSGNQTITFDCAPNDDVQRTATVRISTSTVYVDLQIIQAGAITSAVLLREDMGTVPVSGTTDVATFTGWTKDGTGASGVTYTGTNATIRTTQAGSGYEGASGGNSVFFGTTATFQVNNIATMDNTSVSMTFGCSKSSGASSFADFVPAELPVTYALNGSATWLPVIYTRVSASGWGLATAADIALPSGTTSISFKFGVATVNSVIRIDDVKVVGKGGTVVTTPVVSTDAVANVTATSATVGGKYTYAPPAIPAVTEFGVMWKVSTDANYAAANKLVSPSPANPVFSTTLGGLTAGTSYTYKTYVYTATDNRYYYGPEVTFMATAPAVVIYNETFGTAAPTAAPFTDVTAYTGWAKTGTGASAVTYTSSDVNTVSLRGNQVSSGYAGASGSSNVLIAATGGNALIINNIGITGSTGFDLSFGMNGSAMPAVEYSINGTTWLPVTITGTATGAWQLVAAQFAVTGTPSTLWLRFTAQVTQFGTRLDDVNLARNNSVTPPTTPQMVTGTAGTPTQTTVDVTGNSYIYTTTPPITELGVAYKVSTASTWSYTAAPSASITPYSVTLSGLTAGTDYTFAAYSKIGSTYYYGTNKTFTTANPAIVSIWREDGGATAATGNPLISAWTGWSKSGTGGSGATYTGTSNVTVRTSNPSTGYPNASGGNDIFFGSSAAETFTATGIALSGQNGVILSFGAFKATTAFANSELLLEYSTDGAATWTAVSYTSYTASNTWGNLSTGTINTTGKTTIAFRWTSSVASVYRIDDMTLVVDGSAPVITPPVVTTAAAGSVTTGAATLNGSYTIGTETITATGFDYKKTADPSWTTATASGIATPFSAAVSSLIASTQYDVKAWAQTASGKTYGSTVNFTTLAMPGIVFGTPAASGTLIQSTVVASGTTIITIPYTGALGTESYTVGVTASGAGAAGFPAIVSLAKLITAAGAGNLTIAIQSAWTPSASGAVTYTITGITGLTTTTVNTTVAAPGGSSTSFDITWDFSSLTTGIWGANNSPVPSTYYTITSGSTVTTPVGLTQTGFGTFNTVATKSWGGSGIGAGVADVTAAATSTSYATVQAKSATKSVSFSSITGNVRKSATNPCTNVAVYYQIGAGAFVLSNDFVIGANTNGTGNPFTVDLSTVSALQNLAANTAVTFKFVPYGAAAGSTATWYFNSGGTSTTALKISGTEQ